MKYRLGNLLFVFGIFTTILTSCVNSGKGSIENILKPEVLQYLNDIQPFHVYCRGSSGENHEMITIPARRSITIFREQGPAVITHITFKINSTDPYFLRRILIRIYWDNEEKPSVEVPFGDFFGSGFAYSRYVTPFLEMASGEYSCSFPMPFDVYGKIVIVNETGMRIGGFSYLVEYKKDDKHAGLKTGYFHAFWHREVKTDYDSNYTLLNAKGHGSIVGESFSIQSYDGSLGYIERALTDQSGKIIYRNDSTGRISAVRLNIANPVQFDKGIHLTMPHGYRNMDVSDYSSTVYWYQREPHKAFPAMLKAGLRIPLRIIPPTGMIKANQQKFDLGKIQSKVMDMSDFGAEWEGSKQLLIESGPKDEFLMHLNDLEENVNNIRIYYSQGPDYGNVDIFSGNKKVGEIKGYASFIRPGGYVVIPGIKNLNGDFTLKFKVNGKDNLSTWYYIGISGLKIEPKRTFIPQWNVIGPFPNKLKKDGSYSGLETVYPPEVAIEKDLAFTGSDGKSLRWQEIKTPDDGFVSFDNMITNDQPAVFYALIYLHSSEPRNANLLIGTENDLKVNFNYQLSVQHGKHNLNPDQGRHQIKINRGWNKLLLKIVYQGGCAGFYARIPDLENLFQFYPNQEFPGNSPISIPKNIKRWGSKNH